MLQQALPNAACALHCRGTVIGVLKAFLGLSGSFFTTIYVSFLEPDAVAFLLMLAAVPGAIVLACTLFINYVPYIQIEPHTKARARPLPSYDPHMRHRLHAL